MADRPARVSDMHRAAASMPQTTERHTDVIMFWVESESD